MAIMDFLKKLGCNIKCCADCGCGQPDEETKKKGCCEDGDCEECQEHDVEEEEEDEDEEDGE